MTYAASVHEPSCQALHSAAVYSGCRSRWPQFLGWLVVIGSRPSARTSAGTSAHQKMCRSRDGLRDGGGGRGLRPRGGAGGGGPAAGTGARLSGSPCSANSRRTGDLTPPTWAAIQRQTNHRSFKTFITKRMPSCHVSVASLDEPAVKVRNSLL